MERLRSYGYTVIFLHHTRKNTEFGVTFRGSTAISGAMDTTMTVVRKQEDVEITITKQKDHDEGEPITLHRCMIDIPSQTEGSCVLISNEGAAARTKDALAMREVLHDASLTSLSKRGAALATKLDITPAAAETRVRRYLEKKYPKDEGELLDNEA